MTYNAHEYYLSNRERYRKQSHESYLRNRERVLIRSCAWTIAHRERRREIARKGYYRNREKQLTRNREYKRKHPEYFKEYERVHKEHLRNLRKQWEREHKIQRYARWKTPEGRKYVKEYQGRYFKLHKDKLLPQSYRTQRLKRFSRKVEVLTHYSQASGYPDGIQVLCFNCNSAKGFLGSCPHKWTDNPELKGVWKEVEEKVLKKHV